MLIANILLFLNIRAHKNKGAHQSALLETYLQATAIWMLCAFFITECLSIFHAIDVPALVLAWGVLDVLLLLNCIRLRDFLHWKEFTGGRYHLYKWNWILVAIITLVIILAIGTVPYNWDSITYRLARITYWAQNGSVEHYACNSLRLIANPPLGEFIQLLIYVLCGKSDLLLNLPQCMSYVTCAVVVYALAKRLKCNNKFSFLSALLFLSMPIAFAEALNTQVDLVATLWLLIFVYELMFFAESEKIIEVSSGNLLRACVMGLCVAWGYLTKPSVCIAMAVLGLWLLVICIVRKDKVSVLLRLAISALPEVAIPIVWEVLRNIKTFHAISAPFAGARQLVGSLHPSYLFVNGMKNIISNLPFAGLSYMSDFWGSVLYRMAAILRVDLNAEAISEDGKVFALHAVQDYGHDTAINPIIVWLFLICILWTVVRLRGINWREWYKSYSLAVSLTFIVFCLTVRWEFYVTRYMLSFLTLLCPMIALQLQKCTQGPKRMGLQYAIWGSITCLCLLDIGNMAIYHRNIIARSGGGERPYGYFVNRSDEYEPTLQITDYIVEKGYENIGIFVGGDDYEYPFWALLQDKVERIEHVNVHNESSIYLDEGYIADCVIWIGSLPENTFIWNGQEYPDVWEAAEGRYVLSY